MTPYPPGYIAATNALRDPKSSPEMRHAAQTVLDDINQRRLDRLAVNVAPMSRSSWPSTKAAWRRFKAAFAAVRLATSQAKDMPHLANLRNPTPEPSQWPAVIALVAAAICTVVIAILVRKGWGL